MTRMDQLRSVLPAGYSVHTRSPGDGVTRYRFFKDAPPNQTYFGPDNGIATELGFKAALTFAKGLSYRGNATRKTKTKRPADFTDEDAVLAEVAKAESEDPTDCSIEEDRGLTSFGEGTVYRVKCGGREWCVVEDYDTAYKLAVAVVRQDVEHEPEMFGADLLAAHIDTDRLRRDLHSDVSSMNYDRLEEMDPDEFWREAERNGMDVPEAEVDEDGDEEELREPTSIEIDDLAERLTEEELRDPMQYLADLYGDEDAAKQAIKIAGIDEDALAEDVVDSDGWESTLARYDGNSSTTASGFVYWRDN